MRILLDECVNPRLRLAFPGDTVKTVAEMGWRSLTNGKLMDEASLHFDVFVTLDRNLQFQNPTGKYTLGIVVSITRFNDLAAYRPHFGEFAIWRDEQSPGRSAFSRSYELRRPISRRNSPPAPRVRRAAMGVQTSTAYPEMGRPEFGVLAGRIRDRLSTLRAL